MAGENALIEVNANTENNAMIAVTADTKAKDPQGIKWQITINNNREKGFTPEQVKLKLHSLKSLMYYCLAEEIGKDENTPHLHAFAVFTSNKRFSTLQRLFNSQAYLTRANGSCIDNRLYILKEGKWENTEKAETTVEGSFEEWGEMPKELHFGSISIESMILERILEGDSNAQILLAFPNYLRGMRDVEHVRQTLRADEYRDRWRDITTVYIFGNTGLGKTRSVMDEFGYSGVYAVNNYKHPFDGYAGESVMLFDEFSSDIRIQDMNNYLDGYPLNLPARYSNKVACFEHVFIISNLDLKRQYYEEQQSKPEVWAAFLRRIHKVIQFMPDGTRREYTTADYMANTGNFIELPPNTPTPFDGESQELEQPTITNVESE